MTTPNESEKPLKFLYSALDGYGGYPFQDLFDAVVPTFAPKDMTAPNGCLILWGGGDISPSLYGQHPSTRTGALDSLSSKDEIEVRLATAAIKQGIPVIGICRGAQMMCALAGGKLIQDVDGHLGNHKIVTDNGKILTTTSLHHQMMYPWEVANYHLIAWTHTNRSKEYIEGTSIKTKEEGDVVVGFPSRIDPMYYEPEIVYFPQVKALCIQGHPEFIMNEEHEFILYCKDLIKQYLLTPFLK